MADSIGAVIIDVKSDISHLVQGMQKAEGVVEQSTKIMTNAVGVLATAYSAISLNQFIDQTVEATNEQKAFAEQLSISVESLTKWEYIASKAHVSTDQLRDSFKDAGTKVTEFQRDGESAKEAFKALGISQDFAKEKMYTTERSMEILLKRLEKFPDGMQKATIAQEIFGDEGANIIRVANLGAEAIKKYTQQAIKGNIATSEAFAQKSATYADAQKTLSALEGGWASAVIEESHFLEMGTNMYSLLSDSVMNWTADVQSGNSTFVDGLNSISTGVDAVFPTVVEIVGITASSFGTMGNAVIDVGGVVGDLVGDLVGFDSEANINISTLGHFTGLAMGATMAIENFSNLIKFSANGFEYFGAAISTYAISRLDYLQSKFYASMATISDFFSFLDDDYASSAKEYEKKSIKLEASMHQALADGNAKFAKLGKERGNIIAKMHSAELIQAKMEETAYKVSVRQREAFVKNSKKIKMPDYDKQGKESVKQLVKSIKALKDAEDAEKNKKSSLSKSSLAHTKALKNEATAYAKLKNDVKDYSRELKSFEDEYNQTTMDKFDYKILKLDEEKKHYTEIGAENIKIEKWYSVEYAKIEAERQKSIADSTEKANRVVEEQQKKIADAEKEKIKAFEEAQAEKQKVLEDFSDKLQKLTLSDFEYSKIQLEKEKKEWIENGIEKIEAEKLYSIEYQKILEEKQKLEKEASDKIAQENAKAWEDANAKQKEMFEAYQEEQKKKIEGEVAYQDLLGNYDYGDQLEYEKKSLWYKERGKDVSVEQIKALEKQKEVLEQHKAIYSTIAGFGKQILADYAKTGDIEQSMQNFSDSDTLGDSLRNSDSFWGQVIGYGSQLLSGTGSSGESDFEALQADINAGNTDITTAIENLNSGVGSHLAITKEMSQNIKNLNSSFSQIGSQIMFNGGAFATGESYVASQKWHTGEEDLGINISGGAVGRRIIDNSVTRWVEDLDNSLTRQLMGETTKKLKDSGFTFGEQTAEDFANSVEGGYYQVIKKKKTAGFGLYSSTSTSTKEQDFDEATKIAIQNSMKNAMDLIAESAENLGFDESKIGEKLNQHIVEELKISTKDLESGEVAKKYSEWMGAEISDMIGEALPNITQKFKIGDEADLAVLTRVTASFESANYSFERLGLQAVEFGEIVGNVDLANLNVSTQAYTDNFYTGKEQLELAFGDLQSVFGSMHKDVPLSIEEYRKQVEAIDLTTTKGKELYALYMNNAGAVSNYIASVDNAQKEAEQSAREYADALHSASNAMSASISSIEDYVAKKGMSDLKALEYDKKNLLDDLGLDDVTLSNYKDKVGGLFDIEAPLLEDGTFYGKEFADKANSLAQLLIREDQLKSQQIETTKESVKTTTEAIKELLHVSDSLESYKEFYATFGMKDDKKLLYDIEKANLAYTESLKSVGLESVTGAEYIERYNYALENGLTDEQVKKWDSLGDAMRDATNAQQAYIDSLKAQQTEIRGTMESLIRGEVDRIKSDYDSRVSALDSLRTNAEKYQPSKTVYSVDIYDAIGNWDSEKDNAKIEGMIGKWRDAQIKAGEARVKQLNEEINLSNQLRESILSMQDGAYKSFNSLYVDIEKSASSTIDQLLKDKKYGEVDSVFSSYATQQKEDIGGMEAFLNIAKMNQKISGVVAPDERQTVEFDVSAINETTSKMYDSLIKMNEENLSDVDASIKELWTQNAQYFDATTPFALYMQEGARDATYREKMLEQKQLWETLGLEQKIQNGESVLAQQQFTERYSLKEDLNRAMLNRNFMTQNQIANKLGIDVTQNKGDIGKLKDAIERLETIQREQSKQYAEQIKLLSEQLEVAQQTARNTEESIIDG